MPHDPLFMPGRYFLRAARQMEDLNAEQRGSGGHYVTVEPSGHVSWHFPAIANNEHPLDRGDLFE